MERRKMSDPSNLTVEKISGLFKDRVAELQERARRRIMVHRIHGAEWLLLVVMGRTGQQAIRALRLWPVQHGSISLQLHMGIRIRGNIRRTNKIRYRAPTGR